MSTAVHARAKSLQSSRTLCDPMDGSPPGSSVLGILQARILEWVAVPASRGSSRPGDQTCVSCIFCTGRCVLHHQCHPVFYFFAPRSFRAHSDISNCLSEPSPYTLLAGDHSLQLVLTPCIVKEKVYTSGRLKKDVSRRMVFKNLINIF